MRRQARQEPDRPKIVKRRKCRYYDEVAGKGCRRDDEHAFGAECRVEVSFDLATVVEGEREVLEFETRRERAAYRRGWLDAMQRTRNGLAHHVVLIRPW